MTINSSKIGSVNVELSIGASPAAVWEALTKNIGEWWPEDFFAGGMAGNRLFSLEAEVGGRMYESWSDGGGTLWGTVVSIEPGKTLQVIGNQFPNWGGPTQWYGTWKLLKTENGSRLEFSEAAVGKVSQDALNERGRGWHYLWATMRAYLEGSPAPVWGE